MKLQDKIIEVAGLKVGKYTKSELMQELRARISSHTKTFLITPYSETLLASMRHKEIREMLNTADISIADGIGILWADYFMSLPLTVQNFWLKSVQALWQLVWTGASILLRPKLLYQRFPEKIVGADLIWDLAKLASTNSFKVYLLGGVVGVAEVVAQKLKQKFPDLQIVGTSAKKITDPTIIHDVNESGADMLLVAFDHLAQKHWLAENLPALKASFGVGLGGTFDYIAGTKRTPPVFIRQSGLEWLWRLLTQFRFRRVFNATIGLMVAMMRYKVYQSCSYRTNAVPIAINQANQVLICKRFPGGEKTSDLADERFEDYWQFPQGGLERGEDIIVGAQRELAEETGLTKVNYLGTAQFINRYDWANARRSICFAKFKNRGQEQTTVFFRHLGKDNEVQVDNKEAVDYQWVAINKVVEIVAEERKKHAQIVLDELKQFLV